MNPLYQIVYTDALHLWSPVVVRSITLEVTKCHLIQVLVWMAGIKSMQPFFSTNMEISSIKVVIPCRNHHIKRFIHRRLITNGLKAINLGNNTLFWFIYLSYGNFKEVCTLWINHCIAKTSVGSWWHTHSKKKSFHKTRQKSTQTSSRIIKYQDHFGDSFHVEIPFLRWYKFLQFMKVGFLWNLWNNLKFFA